MKAVAVFPRTKEVRVIEQEAPRLTEPDQVRVRMLEMGICGTDKEICAFEYGTPPAGSDYLVIGHESLGEVMEVGPATSRVKVGDLVVPTVRRPCSHAECHPCRAGYPDFCISGDYTERGIKGAHGFMTEEVVDHERYLHIVPPALRDVAVLTEPLTIAEKARDQIRQFVYRLPWVEDATPEEVRRNELTALVLGAGPVGLLGAMILVVAGFETVVYALPPAPNPGSEIVEAIGGKYYSHGSIPAETKQALFGHIHLIYEATGVSRLAFEVLKLLGPNSIFAMTGVPGLKEPIEVDADLLMRNIVLKNQVVFGTVNASAENFDAAIRDIGIFHQRWPGALRALITSRSTPEEAPGLLLGKIGGIKNVITFESARTMRNNWIDISVPLHTGMVHWPDNPPVLIDYMLSMERGDTCNVSKLSMGSHTGTHMDGPFHFLPEGKGLDEMPLDAAIGRARVIEIRDPESIKPDELRPHHIQQGERLLLKTQNSTRCWQSETFVEDFVYISQEAARYLASVGVQTVGVDYLSVGGYTKDGTETHQALLEAGIWIIEGLDLSQVEPGTCELICLPLKIADSDAAPARAILRKAVEDDDM